ncbi:cytochrome b-c1 complex subunit Rieske-4 [Cucumis melo var. makuwa]|uniref:quinol--cytochrome-c reductase n=2 Tax=Cucumis melo var. makuwa TaxID=1194695 RepID=A0A5D3BM64_CUCMM|nr:cytochrome b-c1 complex subunit Rieske-4 [Cucumis melo var. makuwa]
MTVTRVGCQKFAGGVTGGGGRRLAGDNHRVVSESWSTNFPTLETNTFRVKEWPTIASSLPGSHNILDSADSNDFRSAGFFNTFPIRPHFDRNSRGFDFVLANQRDICMVIGEFLLHSPFKEKGCLLWFVGVFGLLWDLWGKRKNEVFRVIDWVASERLCLSFSIIICAMEMALPGFASDALASTKDDGLIMDIPATVAAVKNPSSKIVYDDYNHERFPPGDPSKRAFAYFVLSGGRFVYASLIRLLVLKFVLSMSASKDVLALASLEVDLSSIEPGSTVTVKWRGKPVFIRRRTEDDIKLANSVDIGSLRDPQQDEERVKDPEWLVVVGVCTHLGCIPLPNAGDYGGWFCPCHGSHYDVSGRIRKGPAPYNLEVPTYSFLEGNKLLIG